MKIDPVEQLLTALRVQYEELVEKSTGIDLVWRENEPIRRLLVDTHMTVAEHCLTLYRGTGDLRFVEFIIVNYSRIFELVPENLNDLAQCLHARLALAYQLIQNNSQALIHYLGAIRFIEGQSKPDLQTLYDSRRWLDPSYCVDGFEGVISDIYRFALECKNDSELSVLARELLETSSKIIDRVQVVLPNERIASLILESGFDTLERAVRGKIQGSIQGNIERFNQLGELAKPMLDTLVTSNGIDSQRRRKGAVHDL